MLKEGYMYSNLGPSLTLNSWLQIPTEPTVLFTQLPPFLCFFYWIRSRPCCEGFYLSSLVFLPQQKPRLSKRLYSSLPPFVPTFYPYASLPPKKVKRNGLRLLKDHGLDLTPTYTNFTSDARLCIPVSSFTKTSTVGRCRIVAVPLAWHYTSATCHAAFRPVAPFRPTTIDCVT